MITDEHAEALFNLYIKLRNGNTPRFFEKYLNIYDNETIYPISGKISTYDNARFKHAYNTNTVYTFKELLIHYNITTLQIERLIIENI